MLKKLSYGIMIGLLACSVITAVAVATKRAALLAVAPLLLLLLV